MVPQSKDNSLYFSDDISHRHFHTASACSDFEPRDRFPFETQTCRAHRAQRRHKVPDRQSEHEDQILKGRYSETLESHETFQVMLAIAMPKSNKGTGNLEYSIGIASVDITENVEAIEDNNDTIATSFLGP